MTAETASSPAPLPIPPGTTLDGRYRVERVLGQGAMGVVYEAQHIERGERVAIKCLLPEALERGEALARFQREVEAVRKVQSAHVAQVLDAGALADGSPYMVIEYLVGHDLADELAHRGPLPLATAVDFLLQALDAVTEAHAAGIVHRDLKPQNLYIAHGPDGSRRIKVLDFGISKLQKTDGAAPAVSLTKTHTLIGSPLYMSPEQVLAAKEVDARSDLWSLGVVLFEALTGAPPFQGDNVGMVLASVLSSPVPPLREAHPQIPEGIERAIRRCLERDLARRTPSGITLAQELAPFASPENRPVVERILSMAPRFPESKLVVLAEDAPNSRSGSLRPTIPSPDHSPDSYASTLPPPPPPSNTRGLVVALLLVLAMVGAAVAGWWFTRPTG